MAPVGVLYTYEGFSNGLYSLAVAAYAGLDLEVAPGYVHYQTNRQPEFLKKFPPGKVPAFESADGFRLFEGAVIARYLASLAPQSGLLPSDPKEAVLVDQWVHFAEHEIASHTSMIFQLLKGYITPYNKPIHTLLAERQVRSLGTLNNYLSTRTFLVGERITLADVLLAIMIRRAATICFDAPLRAQHSHVIRHMETIINQPKLQPLLGKVEYVEKALQYVPPPKEKKEPKPAPAPAAPKPDKKTKLAEKLAVADDDDDDEPLVPEEPKAKNPLDSLPKSSFNLEDWKRAYSNKETRGPGGSLEWFYNNFDKEGYSIWRVDFKYNQELTQVFMSSNQIGGFYNRLEASRKYLFGSVGVLGISNDSAISGVFILRGQDHLPVVQVAPDWESYDFTRLDLEDAEQKKFFEAALAWDLEVDGKKWADGKNFK